MKIDAFAYCFSSFELPKHDFNVRNSSLLFFGGVPILWMFRVQTVNRFAEAIKTPLDQINTSTYIRKQIITI